MLPRRERVTSLLPRSRVMSSPVPAPGDGVDLLMLAVVAHRKWLAPEGREGTRLSGAEPNVTKANLMRVHLAGEDFSQALLPGVDLSGVNMRQLNLSGADLSGANLSG